MGKGERLEGREEILENKEKDALSKSLEQDTAESLTIDWSDLHAVFKKLDDDFFIKHRSEILDFVKKNPNEAMQNIDDYKNCNCAADIVKAIAEARTEVVLNSWPDVLALKGGRKILEDVIEGILTTKNFRLRYLIVSLFILHRKRPDLVSKTFMKGLAHKIEKENPEILLHFYPDFEKMVKIGEKELIERVENANPIYRLEVGPNNLSAVEDFARKNPEAFLNSLQFGELQDWEAFSPARMKQLIIQVMILYVNGGDLNFEDLVARYPMVKVSIREVNMLSLLKMESYEPLFDMWPKLICDLELGKFDEKKFQGLAEFLVGFDLKFFYAIADDVVASGGKNKRLYLDFARKNSDGLRIATTRYFASDPDFVNQLSRFSSKVGENVDLIYAYFPGFLELILDVFEKEKDDKNSYYKVAALVPLFRKLGKLTLIKDRLVDHFPQVLKAIEREDLLGLFQDKEGREILQEAVKRNPVAYLNNLHFDFFVFEKYWPIVELALDTTNYDVCAAALPMLVDNKHVLEKHFDLVKVIVKKVVDENPGILMRLLKFGPKHFEDSRFDGSKIMEFALSLIDMSMDQYLKVLSENDPFSLVLSCVHFESIDLDGEYVKKAILAVKSGNPEHRQLLLSKYDREVDLYERKLKLGGEFFKIKRFKKMKEALNGD